jgi:hypothetical protein
VGDFVPSVARQPLPTQTRWRGLGWGSSGSEKKMKGATKRIHVPGRAAPPHLCVDSRPPKAGAAPWNQPQGTPASRCTMISHVPPSAMGPRAVPARCTNPRGNRRRRAGAMRTHRPVRSARAIRRCGCELEHGVAVVCRIRRGCRCFRPATYYGEYPE